MKKINKTRTFKKLRQNQFELWTKHLVSSLEIVRKFSLSSMNNKKVLILFYPVDFGYVSPSEYYQYLENFEEFKKLNCENVTSMRKFLT